MIGRESARCSDHVLPSVDVAEVIARMEVHAVDWTAATMPQPLADALAVEDVAALQRAQWCRLCVTWASRFQADAADRALDRVGSALFVGAQAVCRSCCRVFVCVRRSVVLKVRRHVDRALCCELEFRSKCVASPCHWGRQQTRRSVRLLQCFVHRVGNTHAVRSKPVRMRSRLQRVVMCTHAHELLDLELESLMTTVNLTLTRDRVQ